MISATLSTAASALSFICPDERDTWIRMGMALKAEFGDDARDTWFRWGATSPEYKETSAISSWKSFKNGGKIGIGSLFSEALARGFEFDKGEREVSLEQLAADKKAREERDAKAEVDRLARAAAAANRAQSQWRTASIEGTSPYLERKQVVAEACRYIADGGIIIPMMRYDFAKPVMVGKQSIDKDGSKKYSGGMDKHGAGCRLGSVPADGDLLLMGEGYATGLSVRMAVGNEHPFYVAFDTAGILALAQILRAKYPNSPILLCADDDYLTGDKGMEKATAAMTAVGRALVVLPVFAALRRQSKSDESLPQLTDFNDLQIAQGLDEVSAQLSIAIGAALALPPAPSDSCCDAPVEIPIIPPAPLSVPAAPDVVGLVQLEWVLAHCALVQGSTDIWDSVEKLRMKRAAFISMVGKDAAKLWESHPERRSISPRNLPKIVRGVAVPAGGRGDDGIVMMLDRYTFMYGTKTVWDDEKKIVLGYDAMALARGSDLAARWLEHPLHMEKDLDKLVFDPTQRVDLNTHINMFEGFPLKPKTDEVKAGLVLDLLYSLCSSESNCDDIFHWVVCWLAFPLQHPGAKMQTALLFFGEKQGTGKSLFFEGIVKPIYGAHGATGGQHQLESTYTMWRSQKLFVLFEEILSRQDKYSYFGLIKHMITGRDTPISQKFKDDRVEANHLNCVMLSNEFQAIPLEPEDRRFLVVDVKNPLDLELLSKIKVALDEGLVEAFYAFLLAYPLGDFNEHTKPLMTPSKQRVIDFGRPDWEAFYLAWAAEDLGVPYCSCLSEDLFIVYSRYCTKFGFRSLSLTKFSELIGQRLRKDRQWVSIGSSKKKLLTVFHVPTDEDETLTKQCERFRNAADIKAVV